MRGDPPHLPRRRASPPLPGPRPRRRRVAGRRVPAPGPRAPPRQPRRRRRDVHPGARARRPGGVRHRHRHGGRRGLRGRRHADARSRSSRWPSRSPTPRSSTCTARRGPAADRRRAHGRRVQRHLAGPDDRHAAQPDGQRRARSPPSAWCRGPPTRRRARPRGAAACDARSARFAGRPPGRRRGRLPLGARDRPPQPGDRQSAARDGRHRRRPRARSSTPTSGCAPWRSTRATSR